MSTIYWLTNEDIVKVVYALTTECEKQSNIVLNDVLKELGVAQARAESSRILGIKFKKSIGKTNNHIPVKLKTEEITMLKNSNLDAEIKGLFNDIH